MSMCVINVVNGRYQRYIPMFLFFCYMSYPSYAIRILLTTPLNEKYKKIISMLKKEADIEVLPQYFKKNYMGHELKVLRWLLDQKDFLKWDNLYIGDIDILICNEFPSLETQHLNHCEKNKLQYSNSVRPNLTRLSGLHFIRRESYYKKIDSVLKKYRKLHQSGALKSSKNEEILYRIVKESGLRFPENWFRPHHGLHLGLWRNGKTPNLKRVLEDDDYCNHFKYFIDIEKSNMYKEVYKITPLPEIINMKNNLIEICK